MTKPDYTDSYAAPAAAGPGGLWRPVLGTALIVALLPALFVVALVGTDRPPEAPAPAIDPALLLAFSLFFSALSWVWLSIVLALLHNQPLRSLLAPDGRIWPRHLLAGMQIALVYLIISTVLSVLLTGQPVRSGVALPDWISWLAILALLIIVQASAEEAVFRGYIVQQLALRTGSRVVLVLVSSGLFGILHYDPGLGSGESILFVALIFGFGAVACLLVIRTGSLSAAIGFHIVNNWVALLLLTGNVPGREPTQLWVFEDADLGLLLVADGLALGLTWFWLQSPISPLLPVPDADE